jgi:hypothetical protein
MNLEELERPPTGWARYYFSIGVQYLNMPHPRLKTTSNDLVWVDVKADTGDLEVLGDRARKIFTDALTYPFHDSWSFMYTYDDVISHGGDWLGYWNRVVPLEQALWKRIPDPHGWRKAWDS